MLHYLKLIVQILMAPKSGWEDVLSDGQSPRQALVRGLVPLAAVAALTVGLGFFYIHNPSAGELVVKAIVVFSRYVLTYFIAVAGLMYVLPKLTADGLVARERVELLSAYCLGIMAIIGILENMLPMDITLLQFLPFYVIVVIVQGRWFLNIDDAQMFKYAACCIVCIILPVFIINRILLP